MAFGWAVKRLSLASSVHHFARGRGAVGTARADVALATRRGASPLVPRATLRPGQTVPVQIVRNNGQQSTVQVMLGSQPGK
jgi:hypothetical protein